IDPVIERRRDEHAKTVRYTGDNNVTYTKDCIPDVSDVDIVDLTPVYLPRVRANVEVGDYDYPYEWYETTTAEHVTEDGVHRCVQCGESGDGTYTFCDNCGSINCPDHIKTERVEGEPVCTGCAVTERFALRKKYFYDEENLERFREEYAEMPAHEKAMENKPLVGAAAVALVLVVLFAAQTL
ncbi:MAG: restriction endonuclease, partial [Halobacteriales archaeon]